MSIIAMEVTEVKSHPNADALRVYTMEAPNHDAVQIVANLQNMVSTCRRNRVLFMVPGDTNPNPLFEQSLRRLAGRFELTTSKAIATKKGRKCKKSTRCLKLYCSCFRVGALCNPALCNCVGCENKKECGIPSENRAFAVQDILLRRPDAFEPRQKRNSVVGGCSCTRTR